MPWAAAHDPDMVGDMEKGVWGDEEPHRNNVVPLTLATPLPLSNEDKKLPHMKGNGMRLPPKKAKKAVEEQSALRPAQATGFWCVLRFPPESNADPPALPPRSGPPDSRGV